MSRRLASCLVMLGALSGSARVCLAQSSDNKAAAQALFEEGRRLMAEGKLAEACKKLEGSQKLDPGAGTLLNLAACYEQNGQTASAWVTYKDAATASADRRPEWAERAREKAAALEPELSRLTINVAVEIPGLQVTRDGVAVAKETFGAALPVDPGEHTIVAKAPGRVTFEKKVSVGKSKDSRKVTIPDLEALEGAAEPPPVAPGQTGPTPPRDAPADADVGSGQRTIGLAVAGLGVVGVIVGGVFGVVAMGNKSDAKDPNLCTDDLSRCNSAGKALVEDAQSAATLSTIGFVAGGALLAGGVVLYLTAPRGGSTTQGSARGTTLYAGVGSAGSPLGLSLGGAFR